MDSEFKSVHFLTPFVRTLLGRRARMQAVTTLELPSITGNGQPTLALAGRESRVFRLV